MGNNLVTKEMVRINKSQLSSLTLCEQLQNCLGTGFVVQNPIRLALGMYAKRRLLGIHRSHLYSPILS